MSLDPNAPQFILTAVQRIYDALPALIGEDWSTIQPQVDAHIITLQNQPDAYLASTQIFGLLARYEAARQRLSQELIVQQVVVANLNQSLEQMQYTADESVLAAVMSGISWEVDPETIPADGEEASTRSITMEEGGVDGGRSIKFRNLDLDMGKMMLNVGNLGLLVHGAIDKPIPFVMAASALVIVGTLLTETTEEIEQQEATVFWGMIQAIGTMHGAGLYETTIREATNDERAKYGMGALTEGQIHTSLVKLVSLKSVAQTGDVYRIVEKFKAKG
jgi:hypothetical protein